MNLPDDIKAVVKAAWTVVEEAKQLAEEGCQLEGGYSQTLDKLAVIVEALSPESLKMIEEV